MLRLHYFPGNASLIPHIVLEEIGAPFELAYVDRAQAAHSGADYLALNPNGLIPVLVDGRGSGAPLVLYETAAVCLHLADTHPAAGLLPALATAERAHAYKWLAWLTNTLQAALILYFYPERWADDAAGTAVVKAHAEAKIGAMLDQIDAELARQRGPWFLGAALRPRRSLRLRAVPLDARLRAAGALAAAHQALARAHARAARRAARLRDREAGRALGLGRARAAAEPLGPVRGERRRRLGAAPLVEQGAAGARAAAARAPRREQRLVDDVALRVAAAEAARGGRAPARSSRRLRRSGRRRTRAGRAAAARRRRARPRGSSRPAARRGSATARPTRAPRRARPRRSAPASRARR